MKAMLVVDVNDDFDFSNAYVVGDVCDENNFDVLGFISGYLKPLPMREHGFTQGEYSNGYVHGWNDCIDAITGETE